MSACHQRYVSAVTVDPICNFIAFVQSTFFLRYFAAPSNLNAKLPPNRHFNRPSLGVNYRDRARSTVIYRPETGLETSVTRLFLLDSIAEIAPLHLGAVIVTGSHGGRAASAYALSQPLAGLVFNDAGIGKEEAGVSVLQLLDERGIPAIAISHKSARIGEAHETFKNGVASRFNAAARVFGFDVGMPAREITRRLGVVSAER